MSPTEEVDGTRSVPTTLEEIDKFQRVVYTQ